MGRRMKLSQLDEQECQWILGVIHRDFALRHREQQRLSKIERELNEAANQRNLLAKRREFNEKCCILCCATFNLLFNKRLLCSQCRFHVCRNCATWESTDKLWLCRVCEQQRVLYVQSCEWFYDHLKQRFKHFGSAKVLDTLRRKRKESGVDSENDSGYGPSSEGRSLKSSPLSFLLPLHAVDRASRNDDNAPLHTGHSNGEEDEEDLEESCEVRSHIETVVQGLVGDNLDTARVDQPYTHPQYLQLFSSFHSRLVEAITNLCQALDVALSNKPDARGPPVKVDAGSSGKEVTPTTAHAALKQAIMDTAHQAASLPALREMPDVSPDCKQSGSELLSSCLFHSYQELLASAIINKLVDQGQNLQNPKLKREDFELSDISDTDIHMNSASKDVGCSDASAGSETESLGSESSLGGVDVADDEFSWATGIKDETIPPRIEYVIEECIEEITEEEITDAEGNRSSSRSRQEERKPLHLTASRQKSVDDPVSRATFDVPATNCVPELDFLNAWDIVESRRVPFPEFGVDIVEEKLWDQTDDYYDDEEAQGEEEEGEDFDNVGSRRSSVTAWEENWLFRKRKLFPFGSLRHQLLGFYGEPPCMLIPNPRDAPAAHPQIDARDVDQLSELSEHNSAGSLDFSDSDSEAEFTGTDKLVELAQNVAHHFNSSATKPYYAAEPSVVRGDKASVSGYQTRADPLSRRTVKERRLERTSNEELDIPAFVPICQRTLASQDVSFVLPPEGVSTHAGKVARFHCQVKGSKPIGVAWFKGESRLESNDRVEIFQHDTNGQHFLNIYDTEVKDSGSYSCLVFGKKSQSWSDFTLQVKGTSRGWLPAEFVVPLRLSEGGELGRNVQLTCTLSGYPEPRLCFFHNKQAISHSSKHTIECLGYGEWRFLIQKADSTDEGEYEAYATNRLGNAVSTFNLSLSDVGAKVSKESSSVKTPQVIVEERRPIVIQRTWWERLAEMDPKGKSSRFLLEPLERRSFPVDLSPPSPAPQDLSCPPRPGTIAEREHRKWEMAAPLANNPYSPENITKRKLERRISDVSLDTPAMSYEEFERQRQLDESNRALDAGRYGRDYYVNDNTSSSNSSLNRGHRQNGKKEHSLSALQDKVYLSADKVSSLEGQVRLLERELELASAPTHLDQIQSQVVRAAQEVDNSSRQVSRVECEVRRLRKDLSSESERSHSEVSHRVTTSEEESEEPCTLPSVKHLANLFTPPSTELNNNHLNGVEVSQEKEVVIVSRPLVCAAPVCPPQMAPPKYKVAAPPPPPSEEERAKSVWPLVRQLSRSFDNNNNDDSSNNGYSAASVQRVHSLTARSLSKEFRQQVARHVPRPMNRTVSSPSSSSSSQPTSLDTERSNSPQYISNNNIYLSPPTSHPGPNHHRAPPDSGVVGSGGGYTSDESSASNTSLPRPTKRRPISKAILQRASYWERRAEQGLLSDNSVGEEFPVVKDK